MLNTEKCIVFIAVLSLATISLATQTCAPGDESCLLNQRKLQLMKEMGIEPVATKNQTDQTQNADKKQAAQSQPFQLPKPQTNPSQNVLKQSLTPQQQNPRLKTVTNIQGQESGSQPPTQIMNTQGQGTPSQQSTPVVTQPAGGIQYR